MLIAQPDEAYTSPRRGEWGEEGVTDIRLALVCVGGGSGRLTGSKVRPGQARQTDRKRLH